MLCWPQDNGEGGIRTRGTASRTHAFQACSFGHSDTSPKSFIIDYLLFMKNYQAKPAISLLHNRDLALKIKNKHPDVKKKMRILNDLGDTK
jgi:hypothetical protein